MDLKRDLWLIVFLAIILSLQFLHLFAIDNRVTELENIVNQLTHKDNS